MGMAVAALGLAVLLAANGGLGRAATILGSSFNGLVSNLTATPVPSAAPLIVAGPPILTAPTEPYTNQPTIDLTGTVPAAVVGETGARIRIYVAIGDGRPGTVTEIPVGTSPRFLVPGLTLSQGTNTFTATILGPTNLESDASAAVAYILDTTKPRIVISSPKAAAVVNAKSVQVSGQTQARSTISIQNVTTNATVAGAADDQGAFTIVVPLGTGTNQLQVTATDPAGNPNTATVSVRRGTGSLTATVSASLYQIALGALPAPITMVVSVTDPDGKALAGASVTFTLAVPGVPVIASSTLSTSSSGAASFTTTLPKGATIGQAKVTVIVSTTGFGDTTALTVITIVK